MTIYVPIDPATMRLVLAALCCGFPLGVLATLALATTLHRRATVEGDREVES